MAASEKRRMSTAALAASPSSAASRPACADCSRFSELLHDLVAAVRSELMCDSCLGGCKQEPASGLQTVRKRFIGNMT